MLCEACLPGGVYVSCPRPVAALPCVGRLPSKGPSPRGAGLGLPFSAKQCLYNFDTQRRLLLFFYTTTARGRAFWVGALPGEGIGPEGRVAVEERAVGLPRLCVAVCEEDDMVATETTSATQALAFWTDLTRKERQVGIAMAQGWTNSEIAYRLALSPKTIENRVSAIYEKLPDILGAHQRVQAALLARSALGMLTLADRDGSTSERGR